MENYFTEEEFTNTFLSLLSLEGINRINKTELLKKLCYYHKLDEYKSLFYSIGLLFGYDKVDLDNSLSKAISNEMITLKDNLLILNKDNQNISIKPKECNEAIKKLAKEFALKLKIEQISKYPMNIYYKSPNIEYSILKGNYQNQNLSYQLITDGILKDDEKIDIKGCIADHPILNNKIYIENVSCRRLKLINAKYAIIRGLSDDKIGHTKVYTLINTKDDLKKICDYANNESIKKSMVRRISL